MADDPTMAAAGGAEDGMQVDAEQQETVDAADGTQAADEPPEPPLPISRLTMNFFMETTYLIAALNAIQHGLQPPSNNIRVNTVGFGTFLAWGAAQQEQWLCFDHFIWYFLRCMIMLDVCATIKRDWMLGKYEDAMEKWPEYEAASVRERGKMLLKMLVWTPEEDVFFMDKLHSLLQLLLGMKNDIRFPIERWQKNLPLFHFFDFLHERLRRRAHEKPFYFPTRGPDSVALPEIVVSAAKFSFEVLDCIESGLHAFEKTCDSFRHVYDSRQTRRDKDFQYRNVQPLWQNIHNIPVQYNLSYRMECNLRMVQFLSRFGPSSLSIISDVVCKDVVRELRKKYASSLDMATWRLSGAAGALQERIERECAPMHLLLMPAM